MAVEGFIESGRRVLYAVPTGDQIARFWHEVVQALAEPLEDGILKKYESDKIIEFPGTEKRIRAKTAWNADTLRGDYGDLIILDEFQLMNEDALELVVYPMLVDNAGDLVLIYTPPRRLSRSVSKAVDKMHAAKLFKKAQLDSRWLTATWTSKDNPHLSEEGLAEAARDMTALAYRQEMEAEDIDEVPGALWTFDLLDKTRCEAVPSAALPFVRVVVGLDPSGSSTNEAGIVGCAKGKDGHGYVLRDESLLASMPRAWAQATVWLYCEIKADRIVAERNFGGDMVREVIQTVDAGAAIRDVTASRGKQVRAEPVSALYEKEIVHHVGQFPKMEEEMCSYVPGISKESPNRMDALVWALTDLFPESPRLTLAERINDEHDAAMRKTTELKKVAEAPAGCCQSCGSAAVVKRGIISHCNQCGYEWGFPAADKPKGQRTEEFMKLR